MNMFKQLQIMQRLMSDKNFKVLMAHPKIQEIFKDPGFREAIQSQDVNRIMNDPRILVLKEDPEVAPLLLQLQTTMQDLLR